jgi:hypothetical protein
MNYRYELKLLATLMTYEKSIEMWNRQNLRVPLLWEDSFSFTLNTK